ncbi:MAG: C1 family peptidase [Candidatus Thermoplasmatota archaeon]|nr:C1 family peptidase [Candidatus Thermoplasmatota archaeon]
MRIKQIIIIILAISFFLQPLVFSQEPNKLDMPVSFDWRNINGVDYSTPVKNQAPAPTCEAYALCAALETILQYQTGDLYEPDLSETHLYFYAGGTYRAGYVNIVDAANYLIEHGVPDEGCYPDPHRPFDYPYTSVEGWENRTVKITEWGWVERTNEAIKQALIDHGPLAACFYLCKDFQYYKGGVYKHRWGEINNGHVMTIFGYDDENQCWIIKNSAGDDWGENGWLRMHYDSALFAEWYGKDTGIMYIEGAYGNIKPDAPKIYIEHPRIFHSYILGNEYTQVLRNVPSIQKAAPRIIGPITIEVITENADYVEFYLDGILRYVDSEEPFEWALDSDHGLHIIETVAYNDKAISRDILDVFVII